MDDNCFGGFSNGMLGISDHSEGRFVAFHPIYQVRSLLLP
ncbi:unnamed protein product [Rhodiola kirilowii]